MPGATVHRGRRIARTLLGALLIAVPLLWSGTTSGAATGRAGTGDSGLRLPQPIREVDPLATPQLRLRRDRLLRSQVPGTVKDTEHVRVAVGPTGAPAAVTDTQRR